MKRKLPSFFVSRFLSEQGRTGSDPVFRRWMTYAEALLEAGQAEDARLVIATGRGAGLDGEDADVPEARIIAAALR